jgi:hypothetical protein
MSVMLVELPLSPVFGLDLEPDVSTIVQSVDDSEDFIK